MRFSLALILAVVPFVAAVRFILWTKNETDVSDQARLKLVKQDALRLASTNYLDLMWAGISIDHSVKLTIRLDAVPVIGPAFVPA